jgi:hypothetical protein
MGKSSFSGCGSLASNMFNPGSEFYEPTAALFPRSAQLSAGFESPILIGHWEAWTNQSSQVWVTDSLFSADLCRAAKISLEAFAR